MASIALGYVSMHQPGTKNVCRSRYRAEEVEQARHRDLGVVAQHGRHRHAVRRGVREVEVHEALGVHVEGERHRAARAVAARESGS